MVENDAQISTIMITSGEADIIVLAIGSFYSEHGIICTTTISKRVTG